MKCPKTIASAALFSLLSAADLPDTSHFYLYDQTTPTIAVVDFHNQGISSAAGQTLTDRFRLTLSTYTPYSVDRELKKHLESALFDHMDLFLDQWFQDNPRRRF